MKLLNDPRLITQKLKFGVGEKWEGLKQRSGFGFNRTYTFMFKHINKEKAQL